MKPKINASEFGSIIIDNKLYDHDVFINLQGEVHKRKKKLSKAIYGSSHTLSEDEARYVFEKGTERIIIGSGQYGQGRLSDQAAAFYKKQSCRVSIFPTPEAIDHWNKSKGKIIGLFHITC